MYWQIFLSICVFVLGFVCGIFIVASACTAGEKRRAGARTRKKEKRDAKDKKRREREIARAARRKENDDLDKENYTADYVPLKERMIDKDDSYAKFNAMADGEDEQSAIARLRAGQDKRYTYVKRKEKENRK